jgi:two-component system NtrC family response regulator
MGTGVLFLSPHSEHASVLSRMLASQSVSIEHITDLAHARIEIQHGGRHVILTEANLPDGTWLDVLELVQRVSPGSEVIVTDAGADARFWAEVLNMGAYDFIAQPFATAEVQRILSNACARASAPRAAIAAV